MTSINTNIAAQTALRTLQSTNAQLDQTQSRISTGLKIGEAKDNAAYWSISTSLKSDNKAMATVKDALSLGAATVDTAYQGLNASLDVLNELKSKITAATQDGVNKTAVQAEIIELQKQLTSIANSSTFSGENWLSVSTTEQKSIVSSFTRDGNNNVSIGTVQFNTSDSALLVGANGGILRAEQNYSASVANTATATAAVFASDTVITFTIAVGTNAAETVKIDKSVVDTALKVTNGTIANLGDLVKVVQAAVANNSKLQGSVSVAANSTTGLLFTGSDSLVISDETLAAGTAVSGTFTFDTATSANELTASVSTIDVSDASTAEMAGYLKIVNSAIDDVTSAASTLGSVAKRIELQQSFVSTLMDTIDAGVSGLIDADMNEESTRLQALQVKQQLGVQALSIANQSAQNVLSLFR